MNSSCLSSFTKDFKYERVWHVKSYSRYEFTCTSDPPDLCLNWFCDIRGYKKFNPFSRWKKLFPDDLVMDSEPKNDFKHKLNAWRNFLETNWTRSLTKIEYTSCALGNNLLNRRLYPEDHEIRMVCKLKYSGVTI